MNEKELIPQLFKTEYRKIISVLCKLFGIVHIEIAEDITNDTFLLASETWGLKGIPENPTAWLYTVAKNRTKDYFKRHKIVEEKIIPSLKLNQNQSEEIEVDLSLKNITDSQLQMIFTICNPIIPAEAQIGLALRILCGFGIDEIAEAFLTNKETINKRLFRAKEKLRTENIKIELPTENDINTRLETVLTTLYLLFNEGYHSSTQKTHLRKELCLEAMRLNYFLIENETTNKPIVNALMALMCFHSSRFEARTNQIGEPILYDQQDKNLWNEELIAKGNFYLIQSAQGNELSKYHLEANIAYWHSSKIENTKKWDNILQAYNQLLLIEYSPITALNRTYALAQVKGKETAIIEAEKLNLADNHFYFSLLGNLYTDIDNMKAIKNFEIALNLAMTNADKSTITKNLYDLKAKKNNS
ncbi:sigma-70 family RNA polymerase sigma factor [Flavobacterium sp.]|uniref:RNA polymerase sigma factor n=1 Tax=Flavobacterium sp. TaxID=239 RepID=UPI00286AB987|nr:sigma-70 family RNA polymerase sigma factor [Flavobacterium sp.]